jgi:site-specific DNA-methyltransferase (adenine-specific)
MNTNLMFSSISNEWETPKNLFDTLNKEFNFTLDPCCTKENKLCKKYYTIKTDGLSKDWSGETVFINPPYGREIGKWVKKCYEESLKGTICVMLIPSRTDTKWFHTYIYNKAEIRFLKGRLKFINRLLPSWRIDGNFKMQSAPFPSMVVVFNSRNVEEDYGRMFAS